MSHHSCPLDTDMGTPRVQGAKSAALCTAAAATQRHQRSSRRVCSHHTLPPHTHTGLVPCPLKGHATGHAGCHRVAGMFSACWLNLGIGGGGFASSLSGSLCSKFGRPASSDVCPCLQPHWPVTFPRQALSSSVNLPLPYCLSPFWLL